MIEHAAKITAARAKHASGVTISEAAASSTASRYRVRPPASSCPVAMREDRAKKIAEILGKPERWNSHGRGIGIRDLDSDEIKLKVVDFGKDVGLSDAIRQYYELFMDFGKAAKGRQPALHTQLGYRRL